MSMEYNINELDELQQMREQIAALRSKLETQQIVSERVIVAAISKGVGNINRRGIIFAILGFLAIPFCCGVFHAIGYSDGFVIGTGVMLAICFVATIYIHFGLQVVDITRDNMLEMGKKVMRLRKQYANWHFLSVPMIVVWGYFLYREISIVYPDPEIRIAFIISGLIGGMAGAVIGLWQHFKVLRMADEVLSHIKELQE